MTKRKTSQSSRRPRSERRKGFGRGKAHDALLMAAMEAVDQSGVINLSMREMQRIAGTSSNTAFKAFDTKENFVCTLAEVCVGALGHQFDRALSGEIEGISAALDEWARQVHARPALGLMPFSLPILRGSDRPARVAADPINMLDLQIQQLIQQDSPWLEPAQRYQRSLALLAMLIGYGTLVANRARILATVPNPLSVILDGANKIAVSRARPTSARGKK